MVKYKEIVKGNAPIWPYLKIRYKGVWDMQEFYESVINWLRDRKWKFYEKNYKHKHPSPFGVERQYVWTAERNVDEFMKVITDIYIHTYDAHDVEVVDRKGRKRIFTSGKIWVTLKIFLSWDYENRWTKTPFLGELSNFFSFYIVKKRIEQGYTAAYRHELVALHNYMMERLKMDTREFEYSTIAGVHRRGP